MGGREHFKNEPEGASKATRCKTSFPQGLLFYETEMGATASYGILRTFPKRRYVAGLRERA